MFKERHVFFKRDETTHFILLVRLSRSVGCHCNCSVHVMFTGAVCLDSVDMLLCHLQPDEACNYAHT